MGIFIYDVPFADIGACEVAMDKKNKSGFEEILQVEHGKILKRFLCYILDFSYLL